MPGQMVVSVVSLAVSVGLLITLVVVVRRYNRILRVYTRGVTVNTKLIGGSRESINRNAERIIQAADGVGKNAEMIQKNETGIRENAENIGRNSELIDANKKMIVACHEMIAANQDSIVKMREQLFLYESRLTHLNGYWILEHNGEKKYFEPGRVVKVEAGNEKTEFVYEEKSVTCTLFKNDKKASVHVFTLAGAPVSGEIYDRGRCVQRFEYNELGQVCEVR